MNINRETDALIVVDLQNDFGRPEGSLYVEGGWRVVTPINRLLKDFDTVVLTQDWHPFDHSSFKHNGGPWPQHCVQNSFGAEFMPGLDVTRASIILRKGMNPAIDSYSAFKENVDANGERRNTGLAGFLRNRGIRNTYFVGLARDYCVKWSALDAVGLMPHFIWELTRPVDPKNDAATRTELQEAGVRIV